MKVAGRITAETLLVAKEMIHEGVTTKEIDDKINQYIKKCGAKPTFLGYGGFPGSACISINDEVIHGIPSHKRVLKNGDIVKIDVGATWNTQNADFIIQTDSTSMGAYFANCGETLPEDYVQKNTYCSDPTHNHISPDRVVDASAGLLPDQTFYFDGQRHDLTALNDIILKLALNLIECDDIKDVYSLPEFPQFNIGRITSNVRIYMNQVKELDTAGMSAAEIAEKNAAVAEAEAR